MSKSLADEIIVQLSTNIGRNCTLCEKFLKSENFEENCNHMLQHGLKCLHIGQETDHGSDGPWHSTVAVFGK